MYLDYFGFSEEPFNITPNSRFLFLSRRHNEALAALLYGIEQRKGFIALTGNIGCGKTTICRALLGRLDRDNVRLALVLNPELSDLELLQAINAEFGIPSTSASKRELLGELNRFLLEQYRRDHNVVLLIDEAQRLSPQALEQVRLISNLETETTKLIQIALVGQPELADILDLPELEQLNQRIMVRYHIEPLNQEEVTDYISHRLEVAQHKRPVRFMPKAIRRIHEYSSGVPRRINVLCDRALLVAFVKERSDIDEPMINQAITELGGMPKKHGDKSGAARSTKNESTPAPFGESREQRSGGYLMPAAVVLGLGMIAFAIHKLDRQIATEDAIQTTTVAALPTQTPIIKAAAPVPTATPEPPVAATPEPPPASVSTPTATEVETPTATPIPTAPPPTPLPVVVEDEDSSPPIAAIAQTTAVPTPSATPAPTPWVGTSWSYDADGIVRVESPDVAYHAAMMTWVGLRRGVRFEEAQLATFRSMTPQQVSQRQLSTGRAPLFLREAKLPPMLDNLPAEALPALVQCDDGAKGFGPWSVLLSLDMDNAVLLDPRHGKIQVSFDELDDYVASIQVPFFDTEGLVGLRPEDEGAAVEALQKHLRRAGLYLVKPSMLFDPLTVAALDKFRERRQIPAGSGVDELVAFRLLLEKEGTVE